MDAETAELLDQINGNKIGPQQIRCDSGYCKKYDIELNPTGSDFYFEPTILRISDGPPLPSHFLIRAPAAVGKSALARHLIDKLDKTNKLVFLVPLRKQKIGTNFFKGLLGSIFPDYSLKEVTRLIAEGRVIFLFDGYDEMSMTEEAVMAHREFFIGEMSSLFTEYQVYKSGKASVMFFYRNLVEAYGFFEILEPQGRRLSIEYFTLDEMAKYLDGYVTHTLTREGRPVPGNMAEIARGQMGQFRAYFDVDPENMRAFFGHAIVLNAFGDYIAEQWIDTKNDHKLIIKLEKEVRRGASAIPTEILEEVINAIAQRESHKFGEKGKRVVESGGRTATDEQASALYSPMTQYRILADACALMDEEGILISDLQVVAEDHAVASLRRMAAVLGIAERDVEGIKASFVAEVIEQVKQHPFLSERGNKILFKNKVYRDFLLADRVAATPEAEPSAYGGLSQFATCSIFFVIFLLSKLKQDLTKLNGGMLFLVCSLISANTDEVTDLPLKIVWRSGKWTFEPTFSKLKIEPFFSANPELLLSVETNGVLQNLAIDGAIGGKVSIAINQAQNAAVPLRLFNVDLTAEEITVVAGRVQFDHSAITATRLRLPKDRVIEATIKDESLLLTCTEIDAQDHVRRVLEAYCNPAEIPGATINLKAEIKKVLGLFRKHGRPEFATYYKRFHNYGTSKGKDSQMPKFLESIGIVYKKEEWWVLNVPKTKEYGIHYISFNQINCDEAGLEKLKIAYKNFLQKK
jgi:hypothetical protein